MPSGPPTVALKKARVLVVDSDTGSLRDVLTEIGFRNIEDCDDIDKLGERFEAQTPDLLFIDIDTDRDVACRTIQDIRTQTLNTENPFVVIVALTAKPEMPAVEAALSAGADDMVVKPVTARALRERVTEQIENRKDFIATEDYVGPDRRPEDRDPADDELVSIKVPNSLRHVATGDEAEALTDERLQETLHSLSVQKFYCLAMKIGDVAAKVRDALTENSDYPLLAQCTEEIAVAVAEVEEIIGNQSFPSVEQVVASTRRAMDDLEAPEAGISARHFELLRLHGHSIAVVLRASEDPAKTLINELEKAVSVIGGSDAPGTPDVGSTSANGTSSDDASAPEESPAEGKYPFKVRFKAWWEGVDPAQIVENAEGAETPAE